MAGRPRGTGGVALTETHRDKIRKSNILKRLIDHAEGTVEMTPTQVTAGLGLLKKALPDLSSVEMKTEITASDPLSEMLARIAAAGAVLVKSDDDSND